MVLDVNLTIIGGLCLLVGLVAALVSNRYAAMRVLLAKNPYRAGSLTEDPKARADRARHHPASDRGGALAAAGLANTDLEDVHS